VCPATGSAFGHDPGAGPRSLTPRNSASFWARRSSRAPTMTIVCRRTRDGKV
jgi:hypothetical protein